MGFRKRNAKRSDNRSSAKVIMGKPASQLSKEEKKILSARMAEIRSENGGKNTVQNTIPFLCMYQDGVCQVSENFFSLTVQFFDANYSISEFEEQNNIFSKYCDVINLFDNTIKFQLTFENQNRSKAKLVKTVQIPEQDDDFNAIRKEYSEMLTDKLLKGSNGQSARKFLTFGIESTSYKAARAKLMSIKNDVIKGFKAFGVEAELLDGRQRLEALYYALNPYRNSPFLFDWDEMLRAGMDTKDFICPPSLKFNKADFEIGNAYGAVWGMNILAGELPDEILKDFLEMQNLFCVNIHVDPLDQIDALKFVKKKLTNVEQMNIDEQKKASQSGYDPDILPPAIKMYIEDIEKLLGDLNSKNERLFHISISLRAYAKSKKELKLLSEMLKRTCQKNNCIMFPYDYRQEQTLVSTLPLGYNEIPVRREMHTSGIAIFVPFTTKELFQDGQATYYGINTLSGNMIRANRSRLKNPNGLILGTPGAGKSFSVKREILDCFLTTVDDIIICDPEGEYFPLVSALHGQLIHAETAEDRLTQIIFCDLGVPHKAAGEAEVEGEDADDVKDKKSIAEVESLEEECDFCVYDDIRDKLIARGIPAEEIAYIHDAKTEQQKADLFDKVRSGEIRVLLGSTAKMGTGTNVQKKLIAVHDLDIPWRPADLEQRAGRIIRQGNENKQVQIFRYVTKGTFDAYSYQTLENKQKFISQIMTSKTPARKCEDVDQQALTYSEIKALCTGDERIKEKLMLENEVKELRVLAAEHRNTVFEMEDKIARFPEQEQKLTAILADLHTDREALRKLPIDPERKLPVFKITIGETEYTDRKEAAKALEDAVLAIKYADTPVKVGSFQGFDLSVTVNSNMMGGGMSAGLQGATSHTTKLIESFAHNLNRLEAALYNIDGRIERTQDNLAKLRLDHAEAQKIVAEPFPQQEELDTKEQRLKVVTDELNQAAIEAKKNAPKREKTCYFERAKMKRDAARLGKKPKTPKDQTKGRSKKQGIE